MSNKVTLFNEALSAVRLKKRADIWNLEESMKDMPDEVKLDGESLCTHYFAPGVCARQMFLPAGSTWVGKIHKTKHVSIISCGRAIFTTENGDVEEIVGPHTFVNQPGEKRALHILEDMIWTAIHVTEETDISKIEEEVIAKDFTELEGPDYPRLEEIN